MVIDKNTTLMHTFSKGMNTDTSDAYLEEGQYRLARNLRYITNLEENSGELHMIEGATLLTSIENATVLAATELRDIGIVITTGAGEKDWQVYTILNGSSEPILIVDVDNDGLNRVTGAKKLSLVTRWEDEDNAKLYIADGLGPIIVIFLNQYDEVLNIDNLIAYPLVSFDVPKFAGYTSGSLKSGMYEYSYQYYIKHGQQSQISPSTKLIPLRKGPLLTNDKDAVSGYELDKITDKGLRVQIPLPTYGNYTHLMIYRIHYVEVGVPPIIEVVYDDEIKDDGTHLYMFEDSGIEALNIISLEEYNMISGIHIIPKTIESMTDYMFAANIENDNPIYLTEVKDYDAKSSITTSIVTEDLIGEINLYAGRLTILNANGFLLKVLNKDYINRFVTDVQDDNNTYANPFVSYTLKSLRRGETYRYGIVFYDKYGNASAVKEIGNIEAPSYQDNPPFEYDSNSKNLIVHPIGVKFTLTDVPEGAVAYEIVRSGKGAHDMKIVGQCVISRPIARVFGVSGDREERGQDLTFPLTPTGWITVMDYWSGVETLGNKDMYSSDTDPNTTAADWWATNSTLTLINGNKDVRGNKNIFQVISPEYCYLEDSTRDILKDYDYKLQPLCYLTPDHITKSTVVLPTNTSALNHPDEVYTGTRNIYSFGNKYTHLRCEDVPAYSGIDRAVVMDGSVDTISCYYMENPTLYRDDDSTAFKRRYNTISNRYSYVKLYNKTNYTQPSVSIESLGFPDSLSWDDFATSQEVYKLTYIDKVTGVAGRNFCNWVCGGIYNCDSTNLIWSDYDNASNNHLKYRDLQDDSFPGGIMMGPGGKCFLVGLEEDTLGKEPSNVDPFGTYLCNIVKQSDPYNVDAKYLTYRSYGNYFPIEQREVTVFDGDCFIQPFEYISQHKWYHPYLENNRNAMIAYSIPVETNINLAYTYGYELSKHIGSSSGDISNILVKPSNVNNSFIQEHPLYSYNSIYSANSTSRTLAAEDSTNDDWFDSKFDYRVFNSIAKSNDETVDNWLKFLPANYIDVDTRYGEITGLRKFVNHLVFWQENATGLLSVNERVLIADTENMPLTLGTADVLSRYDYMNTSNGMRKDEYADTQSDTTLYWWDHNKHEILGYSGGTLVVSVSKAKFALNFLNEMDAKDKLIDSPLLWHDKQFNEVGFTVSDGDDTKSGTLMFGENIGAFSALYTVLPKAAITFKDSTLLLNEDGTIYKWNNLSEDGVKDIQNEAMYPYLKYIVNANSVYTKVFDNGEIAGRLYGGGEERTYINSNPLNALTFTFNTPLKQTAVLTGDKIDNTEYNFRFAIPRNADAKYGGRLRGKTMLAELESTSNSYDFSLQYIFTKYRISWT